MTLRTVVTGIAIALGGAAIVLGTASPERAPEAPSPPAARGSSALPLFDFAPIEPLADSSPGLPGDAIGLVALTHAARTTFLILRASGDPEPLNAPVVLDGDQVDLQAGTLAYLVLPGFDPSENFVEVRELDTGHGIRIRSEASNAILGFALASDGSQLAYLEADTGVVGTSVPWRVIGVDLASGEKRAILDSGEAGSVALLPIAWAPHAMLFRGLTPFAGRFEGLWAAGGDGTGLHRVAAESDFVGVPRLSPRDSRLALLVAEPSVLPAGYGPGEPPANAIAILDLDRLESQRVTATVTEQNFTSVEWLPGGLAALSGERDSATGTLATRSVLGVSLEAGTAPRQLFSTSAGELTHLATCPDGRWLAAIQSGKDTRIVGGDAPEAIAVFEGLGVDWLACLTPAEAVR